MVEDKVVETDAGESVEDGDGFPAVIAREAGKLCEELTSCVLTGNPSKVEALKNSPMSSML